jgi:hypothetical protein
MTGGKSRRLEVPKYAKAANAISAIFAEQAGIVLSEVELWKNEKS